MLGGNEAGQPVDRRPGDAGVLGGIPVLGLAGEELAQEVVTVHTGDRVQPAAQVPDDPAVHPGFGHRFAYHHGLGLAAWFDHPGGELP